VIDSSGLIVVGAVVWFVHRINAKRKGKAQALLFNNERNIFAKATCMSTNSVKNTSILANLSSHSQTVVDSGFKNLLEAL